MKEQENADETEQRIVDQNGKIIPEYLDIADVDCPDIHHTGGEAGAGFDCLTFNDATGGDKGRQRFRDALEECGLDPVRDYFRVELVMDRHDMTVDTSENHRFVWANEDVMVVTMNHPISGEFSGGIVKRYPEPGYASSIAVEGTEEAVARVFEAIDEHSSFSEAAVSSERCFV